MQPLPVAAKSTIGITMAFAVQIAGCGPASPDSDAPISPGPVLSADGVQVHYEVHGERAPALVFVHGWSCDRSYWDGQVEPFARDFKVVTIDLGGHGESTTGTRTAWTMASFGDDVAAVVSALDLERIILIGHSMGGDVIVEAARRLPDRTQGLIWVDAYKQLRTPRTAEQLQSFMASFQSDFVETTRSLVRGMFTPSSDATLVERIALDMSAAPPAVALSALESAMGFDRAVPPALQELNLPVVAINPDTPPTDVESMERNGVEVMFMQGVGHFLMMEDPTAFNALLRAALNRISH